MVRIRLRRVGAKKQPHYRVVVADQRSPRDGRHIETIGFYDPRTEPETVEIQEERALYWLSKGAQPSEVVQRFLEKQGTIDRLSRLMAGEPLEALVAEYEAEETAEESSESAETEPAAVSAEVAEEAASAEAEITEDVQASAPLEEESEAEEEPVETSEEE
jgi:small subunit ribosomal protein S16